MSLVSHALIVASSSTTTFDPHKGAPLPAARVIVLAVPIILLTLVYVRVKGLKK
ncbi:MAG TPA: hypothetical protein VGE75_02690 [Acidimicrobiales bacterium]|jgi:hypothetical protein